MLAAVAGCSSTASSPTADTGTTTAAAPSSAAPTTTEPAPSPTKSSAQPQADLPQFDLAGSGSDCVMTYAASPSGGTLTVVTVTKPGEIITHVSDQSGNLHRNDTQITQGPNAFSYDVPLSQVGDMGAVFTPAGGSSESCTIEAAK